MVKELHVDEVIRNNAFAVYLTEEGDGESRIQFGGYDPKIVDISTILARKVGRTVNYP